MIETYKPLDSKDLRNIVQDVFTSSEKVDRKKELTIFTGINGYYSFKLVLALGNNIDNWVHYKQLKNNDIYLSLFRKEGLYKVLVKKDKTLILLKGTIELLTTKSVSILNTKIKNYDDTNTRNSNSRFR